MGSVVLISVLHDHGVLGAGGRGLPGGVLQVGRDIAVDQHDAVALVVGAEQLRPSDGTHLVALALLRIDAHAHGSPRLTVCLLLNNLSDNRAAVKRHGPFRRRSAPRPGGRRTVRCTPMGPEPHSATDRGSTTAARVLAAATPERWGPSFFGVVPEGGVRRRASDAVQLVLASLLIAICAVVTEGFTARDDGFYEWLSELPRWFDAVGTGLFLSCTVGAVTVVVLALLLSRNLRLALTLVVVGVLTALLAGPLSGLIDLDALLRAAGVDTSSLSAESVVWLAVATAVLLTVAPYLVRPARRYVHAVQLLALFGAVLAAMGPLGVDPGRGRARVGGSRPS